MCLESLGIVSREFVGIVPEYYGVEVSRCSICTMTPCSYFDIDVYFRLTQQDEPGLEPTDAPTFLQIYSNPKKSAKPCQYILISWPRLPLAFHFQQPCQYYVHNFHST